MNGEPVGSGPLRPKIFDAMRMRVLRRGRTIPVEASPWNPDVLVARAATAYTIMD